MSVFVHDCDHCEYLGVGGDNEGEPIDLYIHRVSDWVEFVGRFSDDGPDYFWTDEFAIEAIGIDRCSDWVRRAYQLAEMKGFI